MTLSYIIDVCYLFGINTIHLLQFQGAIVEAIVNISSNTCALPRYKSTTYCEKKAHCQLKGPPHPHSRSHSSLLKLCSG